VGLPDEIVKSLRTIFTGEDLIAHAPNLIRAVAHENRNSENYERHYEWGNRSRANSAKAGTLTLGEEELAPCFRGPLGRALLVGRDSVEPNECPYLDPSRLSLLCSNALLALASDSLPTVGLRRRVLPSP
jgi:hypothetical protein